MPKIQCVVSEAKNLLSNNPNEEGEVFIKINLTSSRQSDQTPAVKLENNITFNHTSVLTSTENSLDMMTVIIYNASNNTTRAKCYVDISDVFSGYPIIQWFDMQSDVEGIFAKIHLSVELIPEKKSPSKKSNKSSSSDENESDDSDLFSDNFDPLNKSQIFTSPSMEMLSSIQISPSKEGIAQDMIPQIPAENEEYEYEYVEVEEEDNEEVEEPNLPLKGNENEIRNSMIVNAGSDICLTIPTAELNELNITDKDSTETAPPSSAATLTKENAPGSNVPCPRSYQSSASAIRNQFESSGEETTKDKEKEKNSGSSDSEELPPGKPLFDSSDAERIQNMESSSGEKASSSEVRHLFFGSDSYETDSYIPPPPEQMESGTELFANPELLKDSSTSKQEEEEESSTDKSDENETIIKSRPTEKRPSAFGEREDGKTTRNILGDYSSSSSSVEEEEKEKMPQKNLTQKSDNIQNSPQKKLENDEEEEEEKPQKNVLYSKKDKELSQKKEENEKEFKPSGEREEESTDSPIPPKRKPLEEDGRDRIALTDLCRPKRSEKEKIRTKKIARKNSDGSSCTTSAIDSSSLSSPKTPDSEANEAQTQKRKQRQRVKVRKADPEASTPTEPHRRKRAAEKERRGSDVSSPSFLSRSSRLSRQRKRADELQMQARLIEEGNREADKKVAALRMDRDRVERMSMTKALLIRNQGLLELGAKRKRVSTRILRKAIEETEEAIRELQK